MRVVIDMQGLQSRSSTRGIGRYTKDWLLGVVEQSADDELVLLFSGSFPRAILEVQEFLMSAGAKMPTFRTWSPLPLSSWLIGHEGNRRELSLGIRSAVIQDLRPDIIHITSLFEGFDEDVVCDISSLTGIAPVTVTFFDLVPLLQSDVYLRGRPAYASFYRHGLAQLQAAENLFAISDCVRAEAIEYLHFPGESVKTIGAAGNAELFTRVELSRESELRCQELGISGRFLLCAGGGDARKNIRFLIESFSQLPPELLSEFQLVIVGPLDAPELDALVSIVRDSGIPDDRVVFAGFVSDADLNLLYNSTSLYVFPSLHEGFGLPALEAMMAGAPVIASTGGNLPELLGLKDALFSPLDGPYLTSLIVRALTDGEFISHLRENSRHQSGRYSWAHTAAETWNAWRQLQNESLLAKKRVGDFPGVTLAYVSPFPPDPSGVATYSKNLSVALAELYDVVLISNNLEEHRPFAEELGLRIESVTWLRENAGQIDRVLYHFGNSVPHAYMFDLLDEVPGTVVLHDFFYSDIKNWMGHQPGGELVLERTVLESHGIKALQAFAKDVRDSVDKYPSNLDVIQNSVGVVVHSKYAAELAEQTYGSIPGMEFNVIPHLKHVRPQNDPSAARRRIGVSEDEFLVATFGFVAENKGILELVSAWAESGLSKDKNCTLALIGRWAGGEDFNESLRVSIGNTRGIRVVDFADERTYNDWLEACDLAVQLRTHSKGESSGTVLDAMSFGKPVIVNTVGANRELAEDSVYKLPAVLAVDDVVEALELLWQDSELRSSIGARAIEVLERVHSPSACASKYFDAIENAYASAVDARLRSDFARLQLLDGISESTFTDLANSLADTFPAPAQPHLWLDLTATITFDHRTGIQRVARALLLNLLESPPDGLVPEAVYLTNLGGRWHYRSATEYMLKMLGIDSLISKLGDRPVRIGPRDILLTLDTAGNSLVEAGRHGVFDRIRVRGAKVFSVMFDLLPLESPEFFPPGSDIGFEEWLEQVAQFDGVACISRHVADRYTNYRESHSFIPKQHRIGSFRLGADMQNSDATSGVPSDAQRLYQWMSQAPTFLMVGTIEPRKGHLQVLDAFDTLRKRGIQANLLIVGQEGWKSVPESDRRDIPQIVEALTDKNRIKAGTRWVSSASDEFVEEIYSRSDALIAASFDEGFGLPLVEASKIGIPLIVRDIPVFREVAGEHAHFFSNGGAADIAEGVELWLTQRPLDQVPSSAGIARVSWRDSAKELLDCLGISNFEAE